MALILNIRGTNGSGKTTAVKKMLNGGVPFTYAGVKFTGASHDLERVALGHYLTPTGGCDGMGNQDQICWAVEWAANHFNEVIFEGVVVSTIYERYHHLCDKLSDQRHDYVWAYLDTPLDECVRRVYNRNGGKAVKDDLIGKKYNSIRNTKMKALASKFNVVTLTGEYDGSLG